MNKILKTILIILNFLMFLIAIIWFLCCYEPHPLIISIGQIGTILGLIFEKQISGIITKRVSNSKIKVDAKSGSHIHTSDIKDSEIEIKNR